MLHSVQFNNKDITVLTQMHLFNLSAQALHMQNNQRVKLYTAQHNIYNPGSAYWSTSEHIQCGVCCRHGDIPAKQDTAEKSELLLTSHWTGIIQMAHLSKC